MCFMGMPVGMKSTRDALAEGDLEWFCKAKLFCSINIEK